ncbi:MAG: Holliday junction resolvase RuvX, partial [Blastocatellia bacterium]
MRFLGIDYGTKSIGLAMSDELGMTTRPLTTIRCQGLSRAKIMARLAALAGEYEIGTVVVGLPLLSDGSRGPAAEKVEQFMAILRDHISIPVVSCNEFLSSREADDILREQGASMEQRRRRSDEFAAAVILRDYLAV